MTTEIIIVFCVLLLIAYVFDLTASKTKIPSVILLMALGWGVQQGSKTFDIQIPDLSSVLPVLGTIGLILIVLEGTLELELSKSEIPLIKKSFIMSLVPLALTAGALSSAFHFWGGFDYRSSLINALPFCIISSAIAIPSVRNWSKSNKTFIIYESSLSDIIGVVAFNFIALNTDFGVKTYGFFLLEILFILVISVLATVLLSLILSRLNHHIKFGPILILIILTYTITKILHLPGLIFIVVFGLTIGNIDKFNNNQIMRFFHPEKLNKEVKQFKDIVVEATFLTRSLFFLLFGFLIEIKDVYNLKTIYWALGIVGVIVLLRIVMLAILKLKIFPLTFITPRGLITILLFYSIEPLNKISLVNESLIVQVILISVFLMMIGVFFTKNEKKINVLPDQIEH